ncbi:MAG: outer membrane protein assembly factor BamB [Methylococcales bacterium]|jgi:outer membrane protein assembly factor BamB|nr:outer membrane protein assembly factor BamB [Methylococcales bacterium]
MRRILLLFTALSLTACSSLDVVKDSVSGISDYFSGGEDNAEPPAILTEIASEIEIEKLWSSSTGVGANEQTVKLAPAIYNQKIITADREGLVQARHLVTGDKVWEFETDKKLSGGVGVGTETVILGSSNAEVIALNSDTGEKRWSVKVSSEVLAIPTVEKHIVIVRTTDGTVTALNEQTGAKLWSYEHAVPPLSIRGTGTPIIVADKVIAGYDNGKLVALDLKNGKFAWETTIAIPKGRSEVERLVDLDVDPIEVNDVIYIASYRGGIAAISASDGDGMWRNENISSYAGLSNDFRYLYLSDAKSNVWQVDQRTGGGLWQQKDLHHRRLTAPATYQNYVVVGDFEGYVHWLSSTDGRQLGRIQVTDSPIENKPVVIDDIVYIYAKDGKLVALKAK